MHINEVCKVDENINKNDEAIVKKNKKWLVPAIVSFVVLMFTFIVVVMVITIIIVSANKENRLQEQLDLGQKYIDELNYEQAVVAYEEAININPKSADAYIGLADTYVMQGDYVNAMSILQEGYTQTGDERILERIDGLSAILSSLDVEYNTNWNGSEIISNEVPENNEEDLNAIYEQKLRTLEEEYGYFDGTQSGRTYDNNDEWLNPGGILGYSILDLDLDGSEELLVCISNAGDEDAHGTVDIRVYDSDGFCHSMPFLANSSGVDNMYILSREKSNMMMIMNIVYVNNQYYIMCEQNKSSYSGNNQNYWLLEYRDNRLQYVGSFTQTVGVGNEYEHTAYKFDGMNIVDTQVYTRDARDEEPLKSALVDFFADYSINVEKTERYTSILTDDNDIINVFYFRYYVDYYMESEFDVTLENSVMFENEE